ncbi:MAG: PAS domain-containing protein, partial [Pleurocapsa sp. SU_196_0]|nr:PAS domain-containing protein [Pleurocapsa sp. SU_196_0]
MNACPFGSSFTALPDAEPDAREERMTVTAESLLESLLAAPIGVAVVNAELRYVRFNSALAAMNDSDPQAPIGRTVREVVPHLADQLEPALRRVLRTRRGGAAARGDRRRRGRGRSWVEHLQPLLDDAGAVVGVVVIIEEDSERRLEAARREAGLRERLDAIPHHAWMTDGPQGRVSWYNRRWHDFTGLTEADIREDRDSQIVHPDDRELLERAYALGMEHTRSFGVEVRLRSRDGFYRAFAVRGEPIFELGQHVGWVGTNTDVQIHREGTERLRGALIAARLAGERSRLAESASGSFVYDWNPANGLVERSANFSKVMGYDPNEIPATVEAWRSLIHPQDLERLNSVGSRVEDEWQIEYTREYRALHRDGEYRWLMDQARVVRGGEGQAQRVVGITTDITERYKMEARLRDINEAQRRFVVIPR